MCRNEDSSQGSPMEGGRGPNGFVLETGEGFGGGGTYDLEVLLHAGKRTKVKLLDCGEFLNIDTTKKHFPTEVIKKIESEEEKIRQDSLKNQLQPKINHEGESMDNHSQSYQIFKSKNEAKKSQKPNETKRPPISSTWKSQFVKRKSKKTKQSPRILKRSKSEKPEVERKTENESENNIRKQHREQQTASDPGLPLPLWRYTTVSPALKIWLKERLAWEKMIKTVPEGEDIPPPPERPVIDNKIYWREGFIPPPPFR